MRQRQKMLYYYCNNHLNLIKGNRISTLCGQTHFATIHNIQSISTRTERETYFTKETKGNRQTYTPGVYKASWRSDEFPPRSLSL